jgi:hypothetical protein
MSAAIRLAAFQDAFAEALFAPPGEAPAPVAALARQPAFAVYRNTVMKGCIDALQANFPAVTRLVGEEWMRAAARLYVELQPPREPSLLAYGRSFPTFLAAFSPAEELPYLADVARLDRSWIEAHVAADAPALTRADFHSLDPDSLGAARMTPHPAARWKWFADAPIYTIWSRNREDRVDERDIEWIAEGALLTRPHGAVTWTRLDESGVRFLDACAQGATVTQAMEAALEADAEVDLVTLISNLLDAGAISRLIPGTTTTP